MKKNIYIVHYIVNERKEKNLLVHNACYGTVNTNSESVYILPLLKMPLAVTVYQAPDGDLEAANTK
jgi:hypothetical protein